MRTISTFIYRHALPFLFCLGIGFPLAALADTFLVKHIQIEGLQRVTEDTVLSYLPVKVGQSFDTARSSEIIKALYQTGFFTNVTVSREKETLIIQVSERPTIGHIQAIGNTSIPKEAMDDILKRFGLVEGNVFNQAALDHIVQGLKTEYHKVGKYNAKITANVKEEVRNRVSVKIMISEGRTVKVKEIKIIGNQAFSEKTLLKELTLSTSGLFTFFNKKDQYTQEKLEASTAALERFYRDQGYLRASVESEQVELSPDRKEVYITLKVKEGGQYTIAGYRLIGNTILPKEEIEPLIPLRIGERYSQEKIEKVYAVVREILGNKGYIFTEITAQPDINDTTHEVFLTFHANPNQQVYVRRIEFAGNLRTADEVLRREMRQPEASLASLKNIQESSRQLLLLNYLSNVEVETLPVPEKPDQVDLRYKVTEAPSAAATAGIGYGTNGLLVNASLQQSNFMGTGKSVGLSFHGTKTAKSYSFNYYNPYYTQSGIGRGFSIYYQEVDPGKQNIIDYTLSGFGGDVRYSIPLSDNSSWQWGIGYDNTKINLGKDPGNEIKEFIKRITGKTKDLSSELTIDIFNTYVSWSYVGLDRSIFPTRGFSHSVNGQLFGAPSRNQRKPLAFYKISYHAQWYQPLFSEFILHIRGSVGYGDGIGSTYKLPFFQNYYAGGIGTSFAVRGYETNSLGPKEADNRALGGNLAVSASASVILPNWFIPDSFRTSLFLDAGNVYDLKLQSKPSVGSGPVRFTSGIALEWRSPIGPLVFSLAKPLNKKNRDETQVFQFTIATLF